MSLQSSSAAQQSSVPQSQLQTQSTLPHIPLHHPTPGLPVRSVALDIPSLLGSPVASPSRTAVTSSMDAVPPIPFQLAPAPFLFQADPHGCLAVSAADPVAASLSPWQPPLRARRDPRLKHRSSSFGHVGSVPMAYPNMSSASLLDNILLTQSLPGSLNSSLKFSTSATQSLGAGIASFPSRDHPFGFAALDSYGGHPSASSFSSSLRSLDRSSDKLPTCCMDSSTASSTTTTNSNGSNQVHTYLDQISNEAPQPASASARYLPARSTAEAAERGPTSIAGSLKVSALTRFPSRIRQEYQVYLSSPVLQPSRMVFWAVRNRDQLPVAIKIIADSDLCSYQKCYDNGSQYVPFEVYIHRRLRHLNIVPFIEYIRQGSAHFIITELHGAASVFQTVPSLPDLFTWVQGHGGVSEFQARFIFRQLVTAVVYLKNMNVAHMDIKGENIAIDPRSFRIKLVDFGSAIVLQAGNLIMPSRRTGDRQYIGTLSCASPEVIAGVPFHVLANEVWSMGVVLFGVLFGRLPFKTPAGILHDELTLPNGARGTIQTSTRDVLFQCLTKDSANRISLEELEMHPFVRLQSSIS